jgi:hypothetical protein
MEIIDKKEKEFSTKKSFDNEEHHDTQQTDDMVL